MLWEDLVVVASQLLVVQGVVVSLVLAVLGLLVLLVMVAVVCCLQKLVGRSEQTMIHLLLVLWVLRVLWEGLVVVVSQLWVGPVPVVSPSLVVLVLMVLWLLVLI